MADDKVVVKVATKEDLSGVKAIENSIDKIKREKIQLKIDAKTEQLKEADSKLANLKKQLAQIEAVPPHLRVNVDEAGINKLRSDISSLEQKKANLKLDIEKSELEQTKSEIQAMENDPINVQLETQTAIMGLEQLGQGFDRLKQGASELKTQMDEVLEASGKIEQTETFLSMNVGAEQAKKSMEEIRSITDELPGDDVTLQNLLSQAVIKDANMGADAMRNLGSAAADYMAGMENFGKTSMETQQDLMNYILAGNTAEIERSPILQSHVDKLKEATTVQERSQALAEALKEEGWAGISAQDTYNNKLQEFNSMLWRGQQGLGDMFREPTEQAMDFLITLDGISGGLVGIVGAAAQMATPFFDTAVGVSQLANNINNLTNGAGIIQTLKDKFGGLKSTITSVASSIQTNLVTALSTLKNTLTTTVIPAIKNAALGLLELSKNALISGANALKEAGMWALSSAQKLASAVATRTLAAAEVILNAVTAANPITLVVLALAALVAVLVLAYQNVDWFRQMVNQAWASLQQIGAQIWGYVKPAFDMISGVVSGFTSLLGVEKDSWINSVLSFLIFIATLPLQLGIIFVNAIAKALGFGDDFVQTMVNGAIDAVNGFIDWIKQMKDKLVEELGKMLDEAKKFAMDIANALTFGGAGMVAGWISGSGEHSPGYMYDHFTEELRAMEKAPGQFDLSGGMADAGSSMVKSFNPNIGSSSAGVVGTNNITINIESVDNEDRIQEIVDAVEEALKFDNLTGGRTV